MKNTESKYTPKKQPLPAFFVDSASGDVITLDMSSARFWRRS
jgi:hypothetical protein